MSYAVLLDWDLDAVLGAVSALPDAGPVQLSVHGLVAFPRGRVGMAPAVTAETMRRQEAVAAAVERTGATVHRHYWRGEWVPHCSLSPRANGSLLPVVARAASDVLPLTVTVSHAALVDSGTGQTWPLPRIP